MAPAPPKAPSGPAPAALPQETHAGTSGPGERDSNGRPPFPAAAEAGPSLPRRPRRACAPHGKAAWRHRGGSGAPLASRVYYGEEEEGLTPICAPETSPKATLAPKTPSGS